MKNLGISKLWGR